MTLLPSQRRQCTNKLILQTVVLEKTLESPLDSKEIKPVNLIGNQPWISLEGLMVKLQYFAHMMQTANSLEKTLIVGKAEGSFLKEDRIRWLDGITNSMDMNLGELWEIVRDREAYHAIFHGIMNNQTWLGDWTTTTTLSKYFIYAIKYIAHYQQKQNKVKHENCRGTKH